MEERITSTVMDVLYYLAEQLGVAVEFIWPILIRQAIIEGYARAIFTIIGMLTVIWIIRNMRKLINYTDDEEIKEIIGYTIFTVVLGITLGIFFTFIVTLTAIFNPEWYIINNIIGDLMQRLR